MELLNVYLNHHRVGQLTHTDGLLSFSYEPDYMNMSKRLPLSRHLPLTDATFNDTASRAFFENLLPEANIRIQVARMLGISPVNIFGLLNKLGGDCAGAVQLLQTGEDPHKTERYRLISENDLAVELTNLPSHPFLADEDGVRLSLAGAQNKLPVRFDGTNFYIPEVDAASTHILKTPIDRLENTVVNEAFCMNLADKVGLKVPYARAINIGGTLIYLVERYDRRQTPDGTVRLHQEDFCQALGVESSFKYEKEGGPGFIDCFDLLRDWSDEPLVDVSALLRWALFNFLIGNADAHAKNISFLYADGQVRLTPFYDLISTAVYERQVNNKFAMRMGGQNDPRYFSASNLLKFSAEIGVGLRGVKRELVSLVETVEAIALDLVEDYRQQFDQPVIVERIERVLMQRLEKARVICR